MVYPEHTVSLSSQLISYLPNPPGTVVAAVSGGSDSVAMLHLLAELDTPVVVAHLDHGLRPDSAEDAQFVAHLAQQLAFPCFLERVDVARVARKKGSNLEATARTLRYAFLTRVAREQHASAVFTAHTLNDQAETILLQLTRGTAQAVGIRARVGKVCRPLLSVSRLELQAYLAGRKLDWREDPTNAELDLDRNFLRHRVVAILLERFPSLLTQMGRHALAQQEQQDALVELAQRITWPDKRWPVPAYRVSPLLAAIPAVRKQALKTILVAHDIAVNTEHLGRLEASLEGRPTTLPGGWQAERGLGSLFLIPPVFRAGAPWRAPRPGEKLARLQGRQRLVEFLSQKGVPAHLRLVYPVRGEPIQEVMGLWPTSPDDRYMAQALALARQAAQLGEVPVGCLVVLPQGVVGTGFNQVEATRNACAHAEMAALQQAMQTSRQKVLPGATVYVTLEPCPMCMGALIEAQVARVVFGCDNPKAGAITVHGMRPPFTVEGGRGERECAKLLSGFFTGLRQRNPG